MQNILDLADTTWLLDAFVQIREVENSKPGKEKIECTFENCLSYCRKEFGVPENAISDERFKELWDKISSQQFVQAVISFHNRNLV